MTKTPANIFMFSFSRNLCLYLFASLLWSLGLMGFFLTYNLHLLDLGFQEKFVGQVMASMTLGSLAAALPSALLVNRFGLNRMIQAAALGTFVSLFARCSVEHSAALILFAFLNGVTIGTWIVAAPPFLAENTHPLNRSRAFSLNYGGSIGMGAIAGLLVGQVSKLSSVLVGIGFLPAASERRLVLISAVVLVFAAFLILLLAVGSSRGKGQLRYGRTPAASWEGRQSTWKVGQLASAFQRPASRQFLARLVVVILLWSLFVGSFAPFFNVFFSRRYDQSLSGIGLIFSLSQFCQMAAVFAMPWVVSLLGQVSAIFFMQLGAVLVLPLLAFTNQVQLAGLIYLAYLSFQVMCEPALENFIMDCVPPEERSLTSAVRYTTHFLFQALAAWITGGLLETFGYSTPLFLIALLGAMAACSFYFLFRAHASLTISPRSTQEAV